MGEEKLRPNSAYDLIQMRRDELIGLFLTLDAPLFSEMRGEYRGTVLDFGGGFWSRLLIWAGLNAGGDWIAKAFVPTGENEGHGYNCFRQRTKGIARKDPMKTYVASSALDDKAAFYVDYRPYATSKVGVMVDEVRKVADGLYLGVSRFANAKKPEKRLYPFLLEGPAAEFVGADS
jgi:hypothetical protein